MTNMLGKILHLGAFGWVMTILMILLYGIIISFIYFGIVNIKTYFKLKMGAGVKGTTNYLISESHTTYQTNIINGISVMQPVINITHYGNFHDENNNIISNKSQISGGYSKTNAVKAVYYNGIIYTDGGKGDNSLGIVMIISGVLMLGIITWFLVGILTI